MAAPVVKIHLYKVKPLVAAGAASVVDICRKLNKQPQEKRIRVIKDYPMKMERLADSSQHKGGMFADFCKQRYHGPGLSSEQKETTNFPMKHDQRFGEMAAMLMVGQYALVQYNHYGPRASSIEEYFSKCSQSEEKFTFDPVLKGDLLPELFNAKSATKLSVGFNFSGGEDIPPEFFRAPMFAQSRDIANFLSEGGSARVNIEVTAERGSSLIKKKCDHLMQKTLRLHDKDDKRVSSAQVKVPNSEKALDLLKAREELRIKLRDDKSDRMISFERRQYALTQAYIDWRNRGLLK